MALVETLKIFLASPGDCNAQRKDAQELIDELNRRLPDEKGVLLQLIRWEKDAYPGYGKDPQQIINAQIAEMEKYALFIGILWNRLGTETPRAGSGTEEEFKRAVQANQKVGQPIIWVYFRESPARLDSEDQLEQKKKVIEFRKEIEAKGLIWTFKRSSDFKDILRAHLERWVSSRISGFVPPVLAAGRDQPADGRLLIDLDPDFDFKGGQEGARTAAYRLLVAARDHKYLGVTLRCEASGIADGLANDLESRPQRSPDEESILRHALKIKDFCIQAGTQFERAFQFIWHSKALNTSLVLTDESNLGEVIAGLRNRAFRSTPVLPGRSVNPEWFQRVNERSEDLFAWHEASPKNYLTFRLSQKECRELEDGYREARGLEFSASSACYAYLLNSHSLREELVPAIALELVKQFEPGEVPNELSDLYRWFVARSDPEKAFNRLTYEQVVGRMHQQAYARLKAKHFPDRSK